MLNISRVDQLLQLCSSGNITKLIEQFNHYTKVEIESIKDEQKAR